MIVVRSRQAIPAQLHSNREWTDLDPRSADLASGYAVSVSPVWALGFTSDNDNRITPQSHAREGCPNG